MDVTLEQHRELHAQILDQVLIGSSKLMYLHKDTSYMTSNTSRDSGVFSMVRRSDYAQVIGTYEVTEGLM